MLMVKRFTAVILFVRLCLKDDILILNQKDFVVVKKKDNDKNNLNGYVFLWKINNSISMLAEVSNSFDDS